MNNKTLSIWLLPNNDIIDYSSIVQSICDSLGKEAIVPHITLVSSFDNTIDYSLKKLNQLFSNQKSFLIKSNGFLVTNHYFKSICVKIDMNNTIQELRNKSLQHFECKENNNYIPHMSLVYGNFEDNIKKRVVEGYKKLLSNNEIMISSVAIAENDEGNLNWKIVKEVHLND